MIYEATVVVTLKDGVLDTEGKAVANTLRDIGCTGAQDARVGRFIRLSIEAPNRSEAERQVEEACRRLLANPVIEEYRYDLVGED